MKRRINNIEFANIEFLPVCSSCRTILDKEYIDVIERMDMIDVEGESMPVGYLEIIPFSCPNCGKQFERILLNEKLPFEPVEESGWACTLKE